MKNIFVVNTHSFVDLITNSSSELFVCNTSKSISFVEEVLKELIKNAGEEYSNCIGEISLSKYNLDKHLVESFKSFQENDNKLYYSCLGKEENFKRKKIVSKKDVVNSFLNNENLEKEKTKKFNKIWINYSLKKIKTEFNIFCEFLKQNKLYDNFKELLDEQLKLNIKRLKNSQNTKHYRFSIIVNSIIPGGTTAENQYLCSVYNDFIELINCSITLEKNQILIRSASDNSIPYDLFEIIEKTFNAERHHLG
jgi:hypothetical protein